MECWNNPVSSRGRAPEPRLRWIGNSLKWKLKHNYKLFFTGDSGEGNATRSFWRKILNIPFSYCLIILVFWEEYILLVEFHNPEWQWSSLSSVYGVSRVEVIVKPSFSKSRFWRFPFSSAITVRVDHALLHFCPFL